MKRNFQHWNWAWAKQIIWMNAHRTEMQCFTDNDKHCWQRSPLGNLRQSAEAIITEGMMGWHSGMMKGMTSHPNDQHQQLSALHCYGGNPHWRLPSFTTMLTEIKIAKQFQQI